MNLIRLSLFSAVLTLPLFPAPSLTVNGTEANYTTSKFYLDELAGESSPLAIVLNPDESSPITAAEAFTNLNNRDRANDDVDGDGVHDGIQPPSGNLVVAGNDIHYYTATTLAPQGNGTFTTTLHAAKTGAYRLTARWKVQGDPNWRYYSNTAANRRDHAITVSPVDAREIRLYELNTLTIEAKEGPGQFIERSTFEDLHDAPGAPRTADGKGFNLDYLTGLGINWIWFQPIHPAAIDGRETDPATSQPYQPGSPYAVKNFFEINPWMSASYDGISNISSSANRAAAMTSFQNFTAAADTKGVSLMLDAPFNHTAYDVEFAGLGVALFQRDGDPLTPTTEIRNYDARFFSRANDYCQRAFNAGSIAIAPDRGDFGKFVDTYDVYFGRYASLVCTNPADNDARLNEGDWFAFDDPNWTSNDITVNGTPRNITKQVWRYFAGYALHWLDKTGYPEGTIATEANRHTGIDGLRCDFGQGLPPRAWEYISNVARERKWNFVFMTETLDGGAVTYRSNRHFDILNENIVFPLQAAGNRTDYRNIFDQRRAQYSGSLVLTNATSHDEKNYLDPYQALIRFSVTNTVQGAPLIFMGQEQGISTTHGFTFYETNFGKQIGHFKKFNSLQPIWDDTNFANAQLHPAYSAIGRARAQSPALSAATEYYLEGDSRIHSIAKFTDEGAPPSAQDVVLCFANLDRNATPSSNYLIPSGLAPLIGLKDSRYYNVKNLAAFDPAKRDDFLWSNNGFTGAQLKSTGFTVSLNRVPTSDAAWATAPFEAQYLKLLDVTPPPAPGKPSSPFPYALGNTADFTWDTPNFTADDVIANFTLSGNTGNFGDFVTATVNATSIAGITGPASPPSDPTLLLDPNTDDDGDGQSNLEEDTAGTSPLDSSSRFAASVQLAGNTLTLQYPVAPERTYTYQTSPDLLTWSQEFSAPATGTLSLPSAPSARFVRIIVRR